MRVCKRLILLGFVAMIVMGSLDSAIAGNRIYQWVDSAGIKHFTNNPANVPSQYRVKTRDMKLQAVKLAPTKPKANGLSGAKLWDEHCAACHVPGKSGKNGLRALASTVIDPSTRFVRSQDVLAPILKKAIEGRTTDMKMIKLNEDELRKIAQYLVEYSKKY